MYLRDKQGYLLRGVYFTARADHRALDYIQKQEHLTPRQALWVIKLQGFDFDLEYVPGEKNNVADYLSQNPNVEPSCIHCQEKIKTGTLSCKTAHSFIYRVRKALETDDFARKL